ncbi:uncharacterized protein [Spinacia oleracea]|uniref:Uncharacterized protein isoform X2 n=1 Tax=Spinacia oleracea TaxID=3562 RepID=A0ABM3QSK5_SPIOL|nr:uncharacterized protein LOC130462037 isoform X2 [Spinacia oleracea]
MKRWADLPLQALRTIAMFLQCDANDLHNFQAVCKNWHHSNTISALLPYRIEEAKCTIFSSSVYLIHPPETYNGSYPWMVSTVKTPDGRTQFCHPFFGTPLPNLPDNLDLGQFRFSCLAEAYHQVYDHGDECEDGCTSPLSCEVYGKTCFVSMPVPSLEQCWVFYLNRMGCLQGYPSTGTKLQGWDVPCFTMSYNNVNQFDDMLCFRGVIYVLDTQGKLYQMSNDVLGLLKTVVDCPVSEFEQSNIGWRKRLAVSSTGTFYLVKQTRRGFNVFELNMCDDNSRRWVKVSGFPNHEVLFVTRYCSFFIAVDKFPGNQLYNSIVYSNSAFPPNSGNGWRFSEEEMIYCFMLGKELEVPQPFSTNIGLLQLLSPQPWVYFEAQKSSFLSSSHSDDEDGTTQSDSSSNDSSSWQDVNGMTQSDSNSNDSSSRTSSSSFGEPEYQEQTTQNPPVNNESHPNTSMEESRTHSAERRLNLLKELDERNTLKKILEENVANVAKLDRVLGRRLM